MKHDLTEHIRDAGYEALFLLGGGGAAVGLPGQRPAEKAWPWSEETSSRRQQLKRLARRGLIEGGPDRSGESWVARLTTLGHAAFAGGRHPEPSWNRRWDGKWRLFTFDLPRSENVMRMKLRRWLDANYFGRRLGSVWISPDPVPALEEIVHDRIDRANFMVFEGSMAGVEDPSELAESSWDFPSINAGYLDYAEHAARALESVQRKPPTAGRLRKILQEDRRRWWTAVRRDPLLPKALHPKNYEGTEAWKVRGKLLKRLAKAAGAGEP